MSLICPECGVPLVPFGGEDVCLECCDTCERHDCVCDDDDYEEDYDDEP